MPKTFNEDNVRELELYAVNTGGLYSAFILPTINNLAKHKARGNYSRDEAQKSWFRVATNAAKNYRREHGSMTDRFQDLFSVADRDECANRLHDNYAEHVAEVAAEIMAKKAKRSKKAA
jgi:hypothetical protein